MENGEYKKLVEFLGKKFEKIDEQFDDIRKDFATKEDLKSFATKDDLKSFATKDDLKSFATKDDLKSFATKDDIQDVARQNVILHEDAQHKLELIVEGLRMHDEKNDRDKAEIMEVIKRLEKDNIYIHDELYKHDSRIKNLEKIA